MAGDYLIDTNIAIAFLDGEQAVVDRILESDDTYISVITVGELYYGASYSKNVSENLLRIDRLLQWAILLEVNQSTAAVYGSIKSDLRKSGRPIPDNDLWIASSARQHDLALASRDSHFSVVLQLQIEDW